MADLFFNPLVRTAEAFFEADFGFPVQRFAKPRVV
jgi:hypothetical protein